MGAVQKISPFLADAAVPRTGDSKLPGYYSKEKDMWVVETDSGLRPIIAKCALAELLTRTRQNEENGDDVPFMLETITKTHQQAERDDDSFAGPNQMLELLSKTDTISEQDDPGLANFTLELLTKTKVELESDDTVPSMGLDTRFYED